jgi:predicted transposase/invertase (TIGR01784 family)
MITEQISRGDDYDKIKRVICIVITDFTFLEEETDYHNVYRWRNIKSGNEFTNLIELNTLEIPKLPVEADKTKLWDWMCFLKSETEEEFEMIATRNPQIGKAVAVLMDLSADERTRMIEESREKARRDWSSRMKGARQEGILIGEQIGIEKADQKWQSQAQQWQSQAQQWQSQTQQWQSKEADYQRQLEEAQRKLAQYEASGRNA